MSHDVNAVFYSDTYHPIQAGSIDGTDTAPHDNGAYRAMLATSTGLYDPMGDSKAQGNPYCIVFVGRLSRDTTEAMLQEVMSKYGRVKNLRLVRHIVTGASQGYAFVEYATEKEMRHAYEAAHHIKIDGNQVLVDYNRQLLMPGWIPRRLGGGLGGCKESGQLRFGGRDRPFRKPLRPIPEKELEKLGISLPGRYMQRFEIPPLPKRRSDWSPGKTMLQDNSLRSPEIERMALDKVVYKEEARYQEDNGRKRHGQRQEKRQVHHEEDERRDSHKEEDKGLHLTRHHEEDDKRQHHREHDRKDHHEEEDDRRAYHQEEHERHERRAYRQGEHERHDKRSYHQEEDGRRKHSERHDKRDFYGEEGEKKRNDERHGRRDYIEEENHRRRRQDKHERRDYLMEVAERSHHLNSHERRGNLKEEDDRRHYHERKKDGHEEDDTRRGYEGHRRTKNFEDDRRESQSLTEDRGSKDMHDSRRQKRRHSSRADRTLSNNESSETDARSKVRKVQRGKGNERFESRESSVENRWLPGEDGTHSG